MNIFVSWAGDFARWAAEGFTKWARRAFRGTRVRFFFSDNDIKPGLQWRRILGQAIEASGAGVFFLTRQSMRSDWVLFEGGAIGRLQRARVFCVLLGVSEGEIPSPFRQYQATTVRKERFWRLVETLARMARSRGAMVSTRQLRDSFDSWWPDFESAASKKLETELEGYGDWTLVSPAQIASRIWGSPFEAKHLFKIAERRLDFIAQNHYFMTVDYGADHLDLLRDFLRRKGNRVNILAMDNRKPGAVVAWRDLMGTSDFPSDLGKAIGTLRRWKSIAARERWRGTLEIRLANLVPTSQTFVDSSPQNNDGQLVMTPMGRKPSNVDRSVILVRKKDSPDAFNSYWSMYQEQWRRARPL